MEDNSKSQGYINRVFNRVRRLPEFLYHLKIRTKLLIFMIIPLCSMLFIGWSQTTGQYHALQSAKQSRISIDISLQLAVLVSEIQNERGLTAGYIGGQGKQYKNQLNQQRKATDLQIEHFYRLSKRMIKTNWRFSLDADKKNINDNLATIMDQLAQIAIKRQLVDQRTDCICFTYYSDLNRALLDLIHQIQVISEGLDQSRYSNNYINMVWLEENSGQERGMLNGLLSSGEIDLWQLQQVLIFASNQEQLTQSFLSTANLFHKEMLKEVLATSVNKQVISVRNWYRNKFVKGEIINHIQHLIGFGGLIHHFKNYLLRGNSRDFAQFNRNYDEVLVRIAQYKLIAGLNDKDINAIKALEQTINDYQQAILRVMKLRDSGYNILAIDNLVKIDDADTIAAISHLRDDDMVVDSYNWWRITSSRIELLRKISNSIGHKMLTTARAREQHAIHNLVFTQLLLLFTLVFSIYLAYILPNRLVGEIETIAGAIDHMNNDKDFNKPLNVSGRDEISQMALAFNSMLEHRLVSEGQSIISAAVFKHAFEAIVLTNADNKIEMVNPAFCQITGFEAQEVIGLGPVVLQSGRHDKQFYQQMWGQLLTQGTWQGEIWNKRKNGEIYPELLTISVVKDSNDRIIQYISMFSDITKHKKYENDIWHQANFDELTGLPNRNLCLDRLAHEIQLTSRSDNQLAVMFIDLDRFKYVNDTLGHDCGDELLKITATRLTDCLRTSDTVARFGGDEFVIILPGINCTLDLERLAQAILRALALPFLLGQQHQAIVSASIGIAVLNEGDTSVDILKNADTAMYQAKDSGRNTARFFTSEMNKQVMNMMKLELELRNAVEQQEFCLHYQPIVCLSSGQVTGAEALIRWQHPTKGMIYPDDFIGLAEETGLIEPIGKWVLEQAVADLKQWHRRGHKLQVAVNVSGRQHRGKGQHAMVNIITSALKKNDIAAKYLKIEITESFLIDDSQKTIETLLAIKELGVAIHIDDFGTGYSSLSYLKRFPIDVLKIDRSFISGSIDNQVDANLVKAVVQIGHSLGLKLIGEGIETQQHFDYLKKLGCHYGQGYHMSRPLPVDEFITFIEQAPTFYSSIAAQAISE